MPKRYLFLLLLAAVFASCTTRYYLVRHAERLDASADSPLSTAGFARANVLRDSLLPKGIGRIYVSTLVRTQQTAQPLADALQLPLQLYRPDTTTAFITALDHIRGMNVLVVGHSNNIPQIVEGLSGTLTPIHENDFDNLFIVTVKTGWGKTRRTLVQTTYGPPSP